MDGGDIVDTPVESHDDILNRHKKEVKDLHSRTMQMKKQATKGEKKKRKDIMKQIEQMELDLKTKHENELSGVTGEPQEDEPSVDDLIPDELLAQTTLEDKPVEEQQEAQQPKKRNRRKEKLAQRAQEEAKMREEAESEWAEQPDLRKIELENLEALCKMQNLQQQDITPDGHCLFASVSDQLKQRHGLDVSVQDLRSKSATHVREHPDTFGPFLFDEETLTMREIEPYCDQIENTAMWGGDMEILALATVYDCPISIMFSGRSTHKVNEAASQPELKLVYYKHSYGLGEHYNSLRDVQ